MQSNRTDNRPKLTTRAALMAALVGGLGLSGCASVPQSGPTAARVAASANEQVGKANIRIVDLDEAVARRVIASAHHQSFAESLGNGAYINAIIGRGDVVNVEIWEAPPSVLFSGGLSNLGASASSSGHSQITEQTVDGEGTITIPFVGRVKAAGRSPAQLGRDINAALIGKAHDPQTLVKVTRPASTSVTVIGEVTTSARVPLSPKGERLLDVLASVGGTRQPVNKMTIQLARGGHIVSMPLEAVIADPQQNIRLQPDDVMTALYQPFSFTALGATGRNEEIPFEATGLSLAQALGRVSGLQDMRANVSGVFIFRMEKPEAIGEAEAADKNALVPVIYRVNLRDPATFFLAQSFPIRNKDILYVSNARLADVQKFVNVVASSVLPIVTTAAVVP